MNSASVARITRVAIVTGAAQGIGLAIALELYSEGFDVVLSDLKAKEGKLNSVTSQIYDTQDDQEDGRGQGGKRVGRLLAITADVSVEDEVKGLIDKVVAELGGVDVMVANAGISLLKPLEEVTTPEWDKMMAVNVRGTFLCYKYAAEQMIKQGRGGRILGACSIAGKKGMPEVAAYCTSKFAIRGLTQSAALEWGKYGITVNAYAPGPIDTDFLAQFDEYFTNKSGAPKGSWSESLKQTTSTGTLGTPQDVANLVSYLVSRGAKFVTGQSINVDGGGVFD
ncbi:hypothetical protein JAAARDRAFT_161320 [Jaapia argillacea MUCL 33604]|uniref:Acetoin reductase family protein n=1 Tax=Jaapia argillacea MUCL 33604 TaxID=933084 RepID=A0A067PRN9_9AGAM|nr:hypothetical protein JAAARDRAFT_161320 [Jaapia argillacea MUCL 33604]